MPRKPSKATRLKKLSTLCQEAVEQFQPERKWLPEENEYVDVTYCNQAVNYIATNLGYTRFQGKLANQMVKLMETSPDWAPLSAEDAKKAADDGRLVVAGVKGDKHGHVAVVMPGREMVWSRKWHKKAPVVASAGKKNWIIGANWAFKDPPGYWAWVEG